MQSDSDVFVELSLEAISKLKQTYRQVKDAFYVYTLLDVAERWFGKEGFTITSPGEAWKEDGSLVVFINHGELAIFPYSLDRKYEKICDGLLRTNRIDPEKKLILVNILDRYMDVIMETLGKMKRKVELNFENNFYTMDIEKAKLLPTELPPGTYLKRLDKQHAAQMNRVWPHRFENSDKAVAKWLSINVGYGLFLKENDVLVSWVMQGYLGHINLLQTEKEYMGRGYGKVMVRVMAKNLAERGYVPVATVLTKNIASNALFRKQGFETETKTFFMVISKSTT